MRTFEQQCQGGTANLFTSQIDPSGIKRSIEIVFFRIQMTSFAKLLLHFMESATLS